MTLKEKLKSVVSGYKNYLKHGLPFLEEERIVEEEALDRLKICAPCENKRSVLRAEYCKKCFCPIEIKARSRFENCIIWDARRNLKK